MVSVSTIQPCLNQEFHVSNCKSKCNCLTKYSTFKYPIGKKNSPFSLFTNFLGKSLLFRPKKLEFSINVHGNFHIIKPLHHSMQFVIAPLVTFNFHMIEKCSQKKFFAIFAKLLQTRELLIIT